MTPKKSKLTSGGALAGTPRGQWCGNNGHYPGCNSCHVLLGGRSDACRSRFERAQADDDSIKATAEAEKDAREASSSATTKATPSATQPASATQSNSSQPAHQASSSSAADTTTSAAADQAAAPVYTLSAPIRTVSWAGRAEDVLMQRQRVEQAWMGPGDEGSSIHTSSGSTRKSKTNEPDED